MKTEGNIWLNSKKGKLETLTHQLENKIKKKKNNLSFINVVHRENILIHVIIVK